MVRNEPSFFAAVSLCSWVIASSIMMYILLFSRKKGPLKIQGRDLLTFDADMLESRSS